MKNGKNLFSGITIALFVIAFCFSVITAFYNVTASFIELAITVLIFLVFMVFFRFAKRDAYSFFARLEGHLSPKNFDGLSTLPFPVCVLDESGEIVWYNTPFSFEVLDGENALGQLFDECFEVGENDIVRSGRRYSAICSELSSAKEKYKLYYFLEDTEIKNNADLFFKKRPTVLQILIDNYDDITSSLSGSEKSRIIGSIETVLESIFISQSKGFFRKIEKDRFAAVVDSEHLSLLIQTKFKILEKINQSDEQGRVVPTLSIGIGNGGSNLIEADQMARQALDMALGRGGDQVAVKSEHGFEFFGGRTNGVEKRAKVRSRMIASALSEMISQADQVLIMGHKMADFDCLGAAVGICRASLFLEKPSYIVIDREANLSKNLVARLDSGDFGENLISPEKALSLVTKNTLLIVVDTHNPELVQCPELLSACKNLVVIDHHRKMVNHITGAVIFYHEPSASSTCEMVAEMLQYFSDDLRLSSLEAEALLSGIMLDTKNFIIKSGVRTFEAAAYLRRIGADLVSVNSWFANTVETYQQRAKLIASCEVYKGCAISFQNEFSSELLLAVPQTADELLHIKDVSASFVMYLRDSVVSISARSFGAINVQLIMEKLGGGGHLTMAGAQIAAEDCESVKKELIAAIDSYLEENNTQK